MKTKFFRTKTMRRLLWLHRRTRGPQKDAAAAAVFVAVCSVLSWVLNKPIPEEVLISLGVAMGAVSYSYRRRARKPKRPKKVPLDAK